MKITYNIGQKVWVPKSLKYKKIIDIEYYDNLELLYMDDLTAIPSSKVSETSFKNIKISFKNIKTSKIYLFFYRKFSKKYRNHEREILNKCITAIQSNKGIKIPVEEFQGKKWKW